MPRKTNRTEARNQLIIQEYTRLFFTEGKRDEVILEELADRFFIQPDTIRKIVLKHLKS